MTSDLFSQKTLEHRLLKASASGLFPSFLHDIAAEELIDRLKEIPLSGLLLGHGDFLSPFSRRLCDLSCSPYFASRIPLKDPFSPSPLNEHSVICHRDHFPFAQERASGVVSFLVLQTLDSCLEMLETYRRALNPGGIFLGVVLSGETLHELRQAFYLAEEELYGGVSPRVVPFAILQEWGNLLVRAGYASCVCDKTSLKVHYPTPWALFQDLKHLGWSRPLRAQSPRLPTRGLLACAAKHYITHFSTSKGAIEATFELTFLQGYAPSNQGKPGFQNDPTSLQR